MVSINFNNQNPRSVKLGNSNSQPQVQPDANEANQSAKQPQAPTYNQPETVALTAEQWQNAYGIGGSVNPQEPHTLEAPETPNQPADSTNVNKTVVVNGPYGTTFTTRLPNGDRYEVLIRKDGSERRVIIHGDGSREPITLRTIEPKGPEFR